ncbi:hypothetical protein [Macrococcoides caseolyticum]|uniref:hypothetical protein n=1 Tax=Macrococcoides caseolyticum TaxID=69966 RepID=UPI000C33DC54|nr:hypothetical protein [Macrococcus caseolyticus]PKF14027.1 hypothetical protein CW690_08750 [Macrococcus caseolyticus]
MCINEFDKKLAELQTNNFFKGKEVNKIIVRHKEIGKTYIVSSLVEPFNRTSDQEWQAMVLYRECKNEYAWFVMHRKEFVNGQFELVEETV